MKPSEQKSTKQTNSDSQIHSRKFSYLNTQNTDSVIGESSRPKILQTISEEAITEQRGSVSNRSESILNTNRIPPNHHQIPIKSQSQSQIQDNFNPSIESYRGYPFNGFDKKPPLTTRHAENYAYSKSVCYECPFYKNKIAELQSSYELLLMAKNEELQECKLIIVGLQQKLRLIEKRSLHEIQKNKKFRSQIEKRNSQELYHRERQNEMIEYLKNREIVLLEQMKDLQNQIYIKTIKSHSTINPQKQKDALKKLSFNSKGFDSNYQQPEFNTKTKQDNEVESNENHSVSEYSAKTFEQQIDIDQNARFTSGKAKTMSRKNDVYSSVGTRMTVELVERVPLNEILKKTNEIECLKDDLLVSELKIKIQQTKSLENLLFTK